ncbi:efflux RND transporter periplasmic adaptor subunit [Acidobacterium sp. S8]|uniref:efflux RND transporter periplasmic adaptor subunit n=1 Tax=Acidobacterium sp. S8 TaxID=1641854 RepID=UPI0020B129D3|nr:efflux RND transporter periplasmic adaptor subunit [Acidobacterium sp. S8]
MYRKNRFAISSLVLATFLSACSSKPAQQAGAEAGAPQAMPVQTVTVAPQPVPVSDEYVSTIKSRRSATIMPQVTGNLVQISVRSGDRVKAGQLLMVIDPLKQEATVATQKSTEQQKLAVFEYNQVEVERQRKLFAAGVTSRDTLDQAEQAYKNSKADYESSTAASKSQENELAYYRIRAPFDGIVGDVPVHVGDYVASSTLLTTVDENRDLEAYIYIPTERAGEVRRGLAVDILDNSGKQIERTAIDFISPQVDDQLQGILAKAAVHSPLLRTEQLVKAKVVWSTEPAPTVPVLAVTRLGGQTFVYVAENNNGKYVAKQRAVKLGDTIGNEYAVQAGLNNGDKVIVSGTQFLVDGAPVQPLG